jgi:hypothetical protein
MSTEQTAAPHLVVTGFGGLAEFMDPTLLATRPESLLFIAIWIGIGWVMLRQSKRNHHNRPVELPPSATPRPYG